MTGEKGEINEERPGFAVGELKLGENAVFIATVSEKRIVDKETLRYAKKTGFHFEKDLRFTEQPGLESHTYPWNSRRTCRKYFRPYCSCLYTPTRCMP